MKFRKKPVVIEAEKFTIANRGNVMKFIGDSWRAGDDSQTLKIQTLEGVMTAQIGDWIIKGINGEFYPCKSDIFKKTYDKAE